MNDDLMIRTEARRVAAMATLDADMQARLGQFFTPLRAAALIAGMPRLPESGRFRILDPGAGVGSLAAAVVYRILAQAPRLQVEIVAVEVDQSVSNLLSMTMTDCEKEAATSGTVLVASVVQGDFIDLSTVGVQSDNALSDPFDLVIMNPPYAKLAASSPHRKAMLNQGVDCPNLYAAFLALGASMLTPGGQLVAITPRSFANGPYFEQFRKHLLRGVAIDRLHTFESRSTVFADTGVLQENIVLSGTRDGTRGKVWLTASHGHTDESTKHVVDYCEILRPEDPHKFLRISTGDADTAVAEVMAAMPSTLSELGIQASTGRVVDFRSRPNLRDEPEMADTPLIYPGNLQSGIVEWPRTIRKPQGFVVLNQADRKLLVPSGYYVVVKRFSAKEERRRIVAAVWDPESNGATDVAFENHLNIFHAKGTGLERSVAVGLSLWLNSSTVDRFFRTFSGHTQVNATDLRSLRFPSPYALRSLGVGRSARLPEQQEIDQLVEEFLIRPGVAA
jgi:adenine-specific DNA-methyltransferase